MQAAKYICVCERETLEKRKKNIHITEIFFFQFFVIRNLGEIPKYKKNIRNYTRKMFFPKISQNFVKKTTKFVPHKKKLLITCGYLFWAK
jgi:hypothetical protein